MKNKIKIAIAAPYPPAAVLPSKLLKRRTMKAALNQHPAPWVRSLCKGLAGFSGVHFEVFSHSRDICRFQRKTHENISYNFFPKYEPSRLDPYHFYLPATFQLLPAIQRYDPDIIHAFGTESAYGLLAARQRRPSVIFIQGIQEMLAPFYHMNRIKVKLRTMLERYVIKKAKALVAETEFSKKWAQGINQNARIKIIPHAVTESFFNATPKFKSKRIISIGALSNTKGSTTIIEAFYLGIQRSPDVFKLSKLEFIGDGPLEGQLKKLVQEYGLSQYIGFRGRLRHNLIPEEMANASMLVIGSRMDTSPNVITEAHAVGIPVIGTHTGGIPHMIDEGKDGFVVPVDNADAMSQRLETLLQSHELCATMGATGHKKVERLNDPHRIAMEHLKFYNEILYWKRQ